MYFYHDVPLRNTKTQDILLGDSTIKNQPLKPALKAGC